MINEIPAWGSWETDEKKYKPVTGRDLFDAQMLSGMNRLPVQVLNSYITRNPNVVTNDFMHPYILCENWLVEGSLILVNDAVNGWHCEPNVLLVEPGRACQLVYTDDNKAVVREYILTSTGWNITEYEDYGTDAQKIYERSETLPSYPADAIKLYMNPIIPGGLIYPVQRTLRQLEKIAETKAIMNNETVGTNYFVNYGGSIDKLKLALKERAANVALPQGTELLKTGGSNLYDQLLKDESNLVQYYFLMTYLVAPERLDRVSGVAYRYALTPQTNFVDMARRELIGLFKQFGVDIEFEKLVLLSGQERIELATFIEQARATLVQLGVPVDVKLFERKINELL